MKPPFNKEKALKKVQIAQELWNTKDPEKVILAYTEKTKWRNKDKFLTGHDEIKQFLIKKWEKELDYKLRKELFTYNENKIAVHFEYEWHDKDGQWYRSYGNEHWTFNLNGLMEHRDASINDSKINESDRRLF